MVVYVSSRISMLIIARLAPANILLSDFSNICHVITHGIYGLYVVEDATEQRDRRVRGCIGASHIEFAAQCHQLRQVEAGMRMDSNSASL